MIIDTLNIPSLGTLKIVETYAYYDEPVLYACKNTAGHHYLVVAAAENEHHEVWLFAGVSVERLKLIRSGTIDLHDAFVYPEDESLLQVIDPYDDQTPIQVLPVAPNQISENMLPLPGERLDLKTDTLPELSNAKEVAKSRRQEILNLTLSFDGISRTEAPLGDLGTIFSGFQKVLNTIGTSHTSAKQPTEEIKKNMRISLLEVGAGSFDVRLASTEMMELFEHSPIENAIEEFLELLKAGNDQDRLKALLDPQKSKVARHYTEFLKSLSESIVDSSFTWASPRPGRGGSARLSKQRIQEIIGILQKIQEDAPFTFEVTGTLTGAFLRSKRFEIKTLKKIFAGTIATEALQSVSTARLSQEYTAEIQEITIRSETTDETKTKHQLLSLK